MLTIAFIQENENGTIVDLDKLEPELAGFYYDHAYMIIDPSTANFTGRTPTKTDIEAAQELKVSNDTFRDYN